MRPDDLTIAIHEAGHAVVGFAVGLQVARVSIIEGDHSWARASVESGPVRTTRDLERQLLADVAGACAESVVFGRPWRATQLGQVDIIRAADTAASAFCCHRAMTTPYLEWAAKKVSEFLMIAVPRLALDTVTLELLAKRQLDSAELVAVFARVGLRNDAL